MTILGINAYHADSSAAIFVDDVLVAAIEEERFRRVKHWAGFPRMAIEFCLKEAGKSYEEVDYYAIGRDPQAKLSRKLWYVAKNFSGSYGAIKGRLLNRSQVGSLEKELSACSGLPAAIFAPKIRRVEHHRSHIASAFFASPFEQAACISIDGSGDFTTTMTGVGEGNNITILDSIDFPDSLGIFYTAFTQLLGFPNYGDEYKVMGMAPYGQPKFADKLMEAIHLTNNGLFKLNPAYFKKGTDGIISYGDDNMPVVEALYSDRLSASFGPARGRGEELTEYHKDLAASVQKVTEDTIFHMLIHLHERTKLDNLCISGGVAQNSVANGKILNKSPFRNVYIPSAGHDAGISMGAALYVQHQQLGKARHVIKSAYTGSYFSNEDIKSFLNERDIAYMEYGDEQLFGLIADCLISGGVVGWFTGKAEFGPRALGGRSILADPRNKDAKELLNTKIKRRENFRPFAPSVLKEYVSEYFETDDEAPFMEKVFPIKPCKQSYIPAVTHVDGTGRLQTVDSAISPRYYALIDRFRLKTGIPILLNTSFNENEPIVNTPGEAIDCYMRTSMDMLVMENVVLARTSR